MGDTLPVELRRLKSRQTLTRQSPTCATCTSFMSALRMTRKRDDPAGTVGGRIGWQRTRAARVAAAASSTAASLPKMIGNTGP